MSARHRVLAVMLGCGLAAALHGPAAAQVSVAPQRLVFDRPGRVLAVTITNTDVQERTFDLSLIDRIMTDAGDIVEAAAPVPFSARDHLLVTPRRVTIAAGRSQVVRIRATPPADGMERRSHLTIAALPLPGAGATADQLLAGGQFSMRIDVAVGISIPLITRSNRPDARAEVAHPRPIIRQAAAEAGAPAVQVPGLLVDVQRLGASSLYGNLVVRAANGSVLGQINGIGVYPEVSARGANVALNRIPRSGERLTVLFTDAQDEIGRILASLNYSWP
jgi:hypothetical protein